jgi:excinuclease ABC subunit A
VETALRMSGGVLYIEIAEIPEEGSESNSDGDNDNKCSHKKGDILVYSENFSCPISGFTLVEIEPRIFSFNSPYGACQNCDGLGTEILFDDELVVPNKDLSLKEGAIAPWGKSSSKYAATKLKMYQQTLEAVAKHYEVSMYKPFGEIAPDIQQKILFGSGDEEIEFIYDDGFKSTKTSRVFEGVLNSLIAQWNKTESEHVRDELSQYQSKKPCSSCHGYRVRMESRCVKIDGKHIGEVAALNINQAAEWFESLTTSLSATHLQIGERALKEIQRRLGFLKNVGLDYLTLNRESGTLSGGESQRIRLASQIGSGLSGVLYVLDEPSIGLHQCDNERLLATLEDLKNLGNTVLVVEHDEDTMLAADHLIDMGPGLVFMAERLFLMGPLKRLQMILIVLLVTSSRGRTLSKFQRSVVQVEVVRKLSSMGRNPIT